MEMCTATLKKVLLKHANFRTLTRLPVDTSTDIKTWRNFRVGKGHSMTTCRLQINCERCCDDKCGHHQLQPASFFNSTRWLLLLSHCNFFFPSSLLNLRTCTSLSQYHITLWCVRWWCSKRRRMLIGSVPPVGLLLCGHSLHPPHSFNHSLTRRSTF